MTDKAFAHDPDDWQAARRVWSAAGVELPDQPDHQHQSYLTHLKHVAGTFHAAKASTEADRTRAWSLADVADQCRELSDLLGEIDDIAFARIAGASPVPADQLLADTISHLGLLEAALINAEQPVVPRKKAHEHNNVLIVLLAMVYEQVTKRTPSVTTNPITNEREGPLVSFVQSFATNFLPSHTPVPSGRTIQRALKIQRDTPDPLADA